MYIRVCHIFQTLDLSFNFLSGVSLLALGVLPALKELRLTGNNLVALPVDMSRLYSIANEDRYIHGKILLLLWHVPDRGFFKHTSSQLPGPLPSLGASVAGRQQAD